jgi:hypothetical protein
MEKDDMVVNKTNNSVAVNAQSATFVSEVRQIIDEALNIAESLGIDNEWIEKARGILIMANSTQLENGQIRPL